MGVELSFGGIIEPNTDKNSLVCTFNHLKLLFQTRLLQFENNTHFFLDFEELDIETELSL